MKSKSILSAFCSVLISCAILCSCSDQQPLNGSELGDKQQSAADTISSETSQDSSDDNGGIYSNSESASDPTVSEPQRSTADTAPAETAGSASADNEDIPTYSMKIYCEQKYDSDSVPIPQGCAQYIDFNGIYYLRTGFGSCTFSESEGDYYDEDNESLCFVTSCIGQEQITEYSQWYEFIAMQECVGSIKDFPTEKILRISDEFLVTEDLLENGYTAYTLWELWESMP